MPFRYDADLLARYPAIVGGVILARGLTNGPTTERLAAAFAAEQAATLRRLGDTPLSEIPALAAWRRVFRGFGVEPTQYRSAAEALLRRLTKQGSIPSINLLVDIGNLVSIRHALPAAVFDTRAIQGSLTVRFADGSERFSDLGASSTDHPQPGEVIFADEAGVVHARRWCWRQSADSAARPDTTAAVITVEGHHADAARDVTAARDDLLALLSEYAGGTLESAILTIDRPSFSA